MTDDTNPISEPVVRCRLVPGALLREEDPTPDWSIHIVPQKSRRDNVSEGISLRIELIDDPSLMKDYHGELHIHRLLLYYSHRSQQISSTWKAPRISLLRGAKTRPNWLKTDHHRWCTVSHCPG